MGTGWGLPTIWSGFMLQFGGVMPTLNLKREDFLLLEKDIALFSTHLMIWWAWHVVFLRICGWKTKPSNPKNIQHNTINGFRCFNFSRVEKFNLRCSNLTTNLRLSLPLHVRLAADEIAAKVMKEFPSTNLAGWEVSFGSFSRRGVQYGSIHWIDAENVTQPFISRPALKQNHSSREIDMFLYMNMECLVNDFHPRVNPVLSEWQNPQCLMCTFIIRNEPSLQFPTWHHDKPWFKVLGNLKQSRASNSMKPSFSR